MILDDFGVIYYINKVTRSGWTGCFIKGYMEERILQRKSYDFSLKIVNLYRNLVADKKEIVLAKQLLRCGTSVGANIAEMTGSQSKKDFLSKGMIAY